MITAALGLDLWRPPSDSAFSQACYATGEYHKWAVLRRLQEQGADFLLPVKANQKSFHRQILSQFQGRRTISFMAMV